MGEARVFIPRFPPILVPPFPPPSDTRIPRLTPLITPNDIHIQSAILPQYTFWTDRQARREVCKNTHLCSIWLYSDMANNSNNTSLTALCLGVPGWAGTRKMKPIWILLKWETVSGSGISWAICKSAAICNPTVHTPLQKNVDLEFFLIGGGFGVWGPSSLNCL